LNEAWWTRVNPGCFWFLLIGRAAILPATGLETRNKPCRILPRLTHSCFHPACCTGHTTLSQACIVIPASVRPSRLFFCTGLARHAPGSRCASHRHALQFIRSKLGLHLCARSRAIKLNTASCPVRPIESYRDFWSGRWESNRTPIEFAMISVDFTESRNSLCSHGKWLRSLQRRTAAFCRLNHAASTIPTMKCVGWDVG